MTLMDMTNGCNTREAVKQLESLYMDLEVRKAQSRTARPEDVRELCRLCLILFRKLAVQTPDEMEMME